MTILYVFMTMLMAYYTAKFTLNKHYGFAALAFILFCIDASTLVGLLNG